MALVLAGLWLGVPARTQADYQETFESPEPSLRLADADCSAEIVVQQRVFQGAHRGAGCERLVVRTGRGTRVYLEQSLIPAQVIDELKIQLWVKGDRPGFQLLARVVLPRTLDRRTGRPITTLVWGTSYRDVGVWQALSLADLPKLVQRQVRILSSERGEAVDGKQAYVDRIVINAYEGPGLTQLWVDDLELDGHATPTWWRDDLSPHEAVAPPVLHIKDPKEAAATAPRNSPNAESGAARVRLQGSVLVANGRTLFPRGVIHRGESLSWLKSLGINTVFLAEAATEEQQAAAERLDLWLVVSDESDRHAGARPPAKPSLGESPFTLASLLSPRSAELDRRPVAASTDRILAVLASPTANDAGLVPNGEGSRRLPGRLGLARATVGGEAHAATGPWGDLVLVDFPTTFAPTPNRPTWVLVDTERLARQALEEIPGNPDQRQQHFVNALRSTALRAISEGARGWCLTNVLPDALRDADVPPWTTALEIVQRELDLINPWISAGTTAAALAAPAPGWRACALEANRARLVILTRQSTASGSVAATTTEPKRPPGARGEWGETTRRFTSASVPRIPLLDVVDTGAPTSADAYLLGGTSLRPMVRQRVAGGVRVQIESPEVAALVVFTQDPLVVNYLARREPTHPARER